MVLDVFDIMNIYFLIVYDDSFCRTAVGKRSVKFKYYEIEKKKKFTLWLHH